MNRRFHIRGFRFVAIVCVYLACGIVTESYGQHYSGIHGSLYSGGLGAYNNPSSIVTSPDKWDLTLFAGQLQNITNALTGKNFPLYLSPTSKFRIAKGMFEREADIITNFRLINGRIAFNRRQAIAFGMNLKSYTQGGTSSFYYNDTVRGARTFLFYNQNSSPLSGHLTSSAWAELYMSYACTLWDQEVSRLNVGATLKGLRGMSGAHAKISNIQVEQEISDFDVVNRIAEGAATYGYSSTHGNLNTFNAQELFRSARGSIALDLGVEYLIKTQAVTTVFDEDSYNDYEWKIGVSLLDLGWNRFLYGRESRSVATLKTDISGDVLQQKFASIDDIAEFNDSLETIVDRASPLRGEFNIINPARAVINIDKFMWGKFYINAEFSINLTQGTEKMRAVRESRLLTVTPRWEDRKFGFYFPVQVTRHGNFWIGGAVKAGPVLFGIHNLLNALGSNKRLAGGGYLALTIRPRQLFGESNDRGGDCPRY